jgi:hypothetical protein
MRKPQLPNWPYCQPGHEGLSHVRIAWLPKNTTSVWQPLDQGVIANFKLHYRRNWVKYMIKEHEAGRDPQKTINLLKTIMWTRVAWESMVTSQTIYNCWVKSTCIKKEEEDTAEDSSTEDVARLETLIAKLPLENPLPINEFLDPEEEAVEDGV